MIKVMIAVLLTVLIILTSGTPVSADEGGQPNDNASWGQIVKWLSHLVPGLHGYHASNYHLGWAGNPPAWGKSGIRHC